MKIAYLGIDLMFPALKSAKEFGCEILKIFTCPCDNRTEFNTEVVSFAKENGIEYKTERITPDDILKLKSQGCELLLCAGYYYLVPVSDIFPMINIHPAPLPQCKGAWPMPLILLGAYHCGAVTVHKMANSFDTGDILMEKEFPISKDDTLDDYMAKANALIPDMVKKLLEDPQKYLKAAKKQTGGRYLENPREELYTVNENMTVEEADRILRAFYSYECYYKTKDKTFEVIKGRAFKGKCEEGGLLLKDGYIKGGSVKEI